MSVSIIPTVGVVYKFTFLDRFTILDGIYRLIKLMTYDEFLEEGGDLLTQVYEPCGLTESDVNDDLETIKASKIMKLKSPETKGSTLLYMPLCFMETTPDHNVQCYYKFGVTAYVGITSDPNTLDEVKNTIIDRCKSMLGINPDPALITVGEEWLTDSEYQAELERREAVKTGVVNYFSENARLLKENSSLKSKLEAYEEIIVRQNAIIEELKASGS